MAIRPIFTPTPDKKTLYVEQNIEFKFYNGFSVTQKAKSIASLHDSAYSEGYKRLLEVSTKSNDLLGHRLSAFNLMIETNDYGSISIESAFQGSKIFENGKAYHDIYHKDSLSAKRDPRLKNSGALTGFVFEGKEWGLEPKSAFYDWIYIKALYPLLKEIKDELLMYDGFTDIEFNPKKSINCQARSCAILVSLIKSERLEDALESTADFKSIVYQKSPVQSVFEL